MSIFHIIFVSVLVAGAWSYSIHRQIEVSKSFIAQFSIKCSDAAFGIGEVYLTSDIPAVGVAECVNGNIKFTGDLPKQVLYISTMLHPKSPKKNICVLWKHSTKADTYSVRVRAGTGKNNTELFYAPKERNVMCLYDSHGHASGKITKVKNGITRPHDTIVRKGTPMSNRITLKVVNVLGEDITSKSMNLDRLVQLKAEVETHYGETLFLYAVSCVAMNKAGSMYYMIRGSCGDGIVFPMNQGFTSYGNVTTSPYFRTFRLKGGHDLSIRCLFARCNWEDCSGKNSCPYFIEPKPTKLPTTPSHTTSTKKPKAHPKVFPPKAPLPKVIKPKVPLPKLVVPKVPLPKIVPTPKKKPIIKP